MDSRLEWRRPQLRKMPAVDARKTHHTPDGSMPIQS